MEWAIFNWRIIEKQFDVKGIADLGHLKLRQLDSLSLAEGNKKLYLRRAK
jgi:hypothetical protein